jgi:ribosomal protein L11 methyltransferase
MNKIFCSLDERYVNPLFEVFDGGDFILSSYRDIEERLTQVQIYYPDPAPPRTLAEETQEAKARLSAALEIVGVEAEISETTIPDEDWKLSYRRHFTTERIGERLVVRPPWEPLPAEGVVLTLDPGLAFGTGKHETTRACLGFIDSLASTGGTFLDMGCGSGILSIAAAKLGFSPVTGFDVDQEAVEASIENAALNDATVTFFRYGLGATVRRALPQADLVAANILGPLLIRFADEIVPCVKRHLIISGILEELYPEVLAAYTARGLVELSRTTIGEWTTGLLVRADAQPA